MRRVTLQAALFVLVPIACWSVRASSALGAFTLRLWREAQA